jgi:ADP-heptose:LPS heptosyltransferase
MRILILAGGGIGDILMTTPMFRAIKAAYPHTFLTVGVLGNLNRELLALNKNVDGTFAMEDKKYKGLTGLVRLVLFLRKAKYDYCFYNHIGAGRRFFIVPLLSGIKNRVGFNRENIVKKRGYRFFVKLLTQSVPYVYGDKRRTEKNLALLKVRGIENHDYTYDLGFSPRGSGRTPAEIVGIHPGSDRNGVIKRWDLKKFNLLARRIVSRYGYGIRFYIGPQESELAEALDRGPTVEIVREKELVGLMENMSQCRFFISNDSGLSHLAAALEIPAVVIYGPTVKEEYILPAKHAAVEIENLGCRPCLYSNGECRAGKTCLNQIEVDDVLAAFARLQ